MGTPLRLVENNLHEIAVAGQHMLFHIPSSSLFELDGAAADVIALIRNRPDLTGNQLQQQLKTQYPGETVEGVLCELIAMELISDGRALTPEIGIDRVGDLALNTLVLNINTGCNLSCTYCYKEDLDKPSAAIKMSFDTARDAIEMMLRNSPDEATYHLVFFGGEPLGNLSLIREVVEFAESRFFVLGKDVNFTLTTNGTLLNDQTIEFLDQHRFGISVSMDGPEALHDRNRLTVGGKGTYAVVAQNVRTLLGRYRSRPVGARVTLTRGNTDVEMIWDHLFNELGFAEVGFAPVTCGDVDIFNLTEQELVQVFANMKALGKRYLKAAIKDKNIGFSNMHQLMTDIHEGNKKALPCGAGIAMLAVDHAGDLNLCHRFSGSGVMGFGSIYGDIQQDDLADFLSKRLDRADSGCSCCHIRNLCSGGCYHESYARYQDASLPTYHYCDLLRDWVDFGIQVYAQIQHDNPGFFDRYITPRTASRLGHDGA